MVWGSAFEYQRRLDGEKLGWTSSLWALGVTIILGKVLV